MKPLKMQVICTEPEQENANSRWRRQNGHASIQFVWWFSQRPLAPSNQQGLWKCQKLGYLSRRIVILQHSAFVLGSKWIGILALSVWGRKASRLQKCIQTIQYCYAVYKMVRNIFIWKITWIQGYFNSFTINVFPFKKHFLYNATKAFFGYINIPVL